jgi:hypothetical protein
MVEGFLEIIAQRDLVELPWMDMCVLRIPTREITSIIGK